MSTLSACRVLPGETRAYGSHDAITRPVPEAGEIDNIRYALGITA
jgi:hypothetical protein